MSNENDIGILNHLPWTEEQGKDPQNQKVIIFYFSLTTCAYCKKGLAWLRENHINFKWLHLDSLPIDLKQHVKHTIQSYYKLSSRMASPFVIFRFPDRDYISNGYDIDYWKSKAR